MLREACVIPPAAAPLELDDDLEPDEPADTVDLVPSPAADIFEEQAPVAATDD